MEELEKYVKKIIEKMIPLLDEILNTVQLSEFLGISKKNLYRLIYEEQLPAHPLPSGEFRFIKSEILRWLSKRNI
jgi:excisionase family DNA binding protein